MITKIKRQDCLDSYPKFPQREYDKRIEEEVHFYPKIYAGYWVKLESRSTKGLLKILAAEIPNLFKKLNIHELIFLGDTERAWISKLAAERADYKPLITALAYLSHNNIGKRFNGAIEVPLSELNTFIQHFYIMTMCDASFAYYHFMDKKQNIIGCIHYSGEMQIWTLNKSTDILFLETVRTTKFQDANRENSDRI